VQQTTVTSDDETLLEKQTKKYPARNRKSLYELNSVGVTENTTDVTKPPKTPTGKENVRRRTTTARKSMLVARKNMASAKNNKNGNDDGDNDDDDDDDGDVDSDDSSKFRGRKRIGKSSHDEDPDYKDPGYVDKSPVKVWTLEGGLNGNCDDASDDDDTDDEIKETIPSKQKRKDVSVTDPNNNISATTTKKKKSSAVIAHHNDDDYMPGNNNSLMEDEQREDDVEMKNDDDEYDNEFTEVFERANEALAVAEEDISAEKPEESQGEGDDEEEEVNAARPRVLTANALDGQSIFGFVTPKRKNALAKIAQDVIDSAKQSKRKSKVYVKSTRKSTTKLAPVTPKSILKPSKETTSKGETGSGGDRKLRNKVTLLRTLAANESEDSESEDDDEDEDEDDVSDGSEDEEKNSKPTKKEDGRDILDEYFEVHGKTSMLTSDKTLAKLKNPKMDQQELLKHLKEVQSSHIKEIVKLHSLHERKYRSWMLNMLSGFNVLLYGFGSKHMLLEKFRKNMLLEHAHIVINGFFPSIQLRQVLKTITEDILTDAQTQFKNTIEHYEYITREYDSGGRGKLFLIVHNIDGHMLRSANTQTALAHLAQSCNIHVIATIDHINAPLVWDQKRASAFNWLWYDTTTFESYSEETSYENSLMVQQSGTLALSSLKHVLHSLTSNSKGIFRVLADYHLDNEDNSSYQGMAFNDLYQRCRERFLVNSDLTLRGQLTEFRDHKLIKSKKGVDGVEYLAIALDCATLRTYLEEDGDG